MKAETCRTGRMVTALLILVFMAAASLGAGTVPVWGAEVFYGEEGGRYVKEADPVLIITGAGANQGDGFQGNYKYLTRKQLDSIDSESAADLYFPSETRDSYIKDTVYSARTKDAQGGWGTFTVSGLDLRAAAESLGIDTADDPAVYVKGKDGYSSTLPKLFSEKRYAFSSENGGKAVQVYPAVALKSKGMERELPRVIMGQTSAADFNMLSWVKQVKTIRIGAKETALTLNLNGQKKSCTLADIIGTKSGSYTSRCQYTENGQEKTVTATGVPLDRFLSDLGVGGKNKIKTSQGKVIADPENYFLAYDAEVSGEQVKSSGQLILYGPGETKEEAVTENITGFSVTVASPAAVRGVKAVKKSYNQIRLTWKKAAGVQGYDIYRKSGSQKQYRLLDCAEGAGNTSYTDRMLKTGTVYQYKIKAYVTAGGMDIEGAFSSSTGAKPVLDTAKIKLSKSGKKDVKVKWKRIPGASGYQICFGKNQKMTKGKKIYTVKKGTAVSAKVTVPDKNRRYYVKVRPYRSVSGKKVYGSYSAVKSIKR